MYLGHNNSINYLSYSHHKKPEINILTASNDATVRLWTANKIDQAAIVFSHDHFPPPSTLPPTATMSTAGNNMTLLNTTSTGTRTTTTTTTNMNTKQRNRPFTNEMKIAQFYYQDQFVLLVSYLFIFIFPLFFLFFLFFFIFGFFLKIDSSSRSLYVSI